METKSHRTAEALPVAEKGRTIEKAGVMVSNLKGEMLIQTRQKDGKLDISACGGRKARELPCKAAEREAEEEIGHEFGDEDLVRPRYVRGMVVYEIKGDFHLSDFSPGQHEVKALKFYTAGELRKIIEDSPESVSTRLRDFLELFCLQRD